jgi:hypothetical protein
MPSDIVFDQVDGDSISLDAARVVVTGRINLPSVTGATPPSDGRPGDLVLTVETGGNPAIGLLLTTTRLWLCVLPQGGDNPALTWWREVQLGPTVAGG